MKNFNFSLQCFSCILSYVARTLQKCCCTSIGFSKNALFWRIPQETVGNIGFTHFCPWATMYVSIYKGKLSLSKDFLKREMHFVMLLNLGHYVQGCYIFERMLSSQIASSFQEFSLQNFILFLQQCSKIRIQKQVMKSLHSLI